MENIIPNVREALEKHRSKRHEINRSIEEFKKLFNGNAYHCVRCDEYYGNHEKQDHLFVATIDLSTLQERHLVFDDENVRIYIDCDGVDVQPNGNADYKKLIFNSLHVIIQNILAAIEEENRKLETYDYYLSKLYAFVSLFEVENKKDD